MILKLRNYLFLIMILSGYQMKAQLNAKYTASSLRGCAPLSVSFSDLSTGSPTSWEWNFGNGNRSILQNPSAIYTNPGKYNVTLKVKDASGGTSSVTNLTILVFKNPIAEFNFNKTSVCANDPISFTDNSILGDTTIKLFQWDFGNGQVSNLKNPPYGYQNQGLYSVSLSLIDNNGCKNTKYKKDVIAVNPSPVAKFSQSNAVFCINPSTVNFKNQTTGTGNAYLWNFGDGQTSTTENPNKTYGSLGNYNVSLKVTNSFNCSHSFSVSNAVKIEPLKADFLIKNPNICVGDKIIIENRSSNMPDLEYTWYFSDGSTSNKLNPNKAFKKSGEYEVSLSIKNEDCNDFYTSKIKIKVSDRPVAKIKINNTFFCSTDSVLIFNGEGKNIKGYTYFINNQKYFKSNSEPVFLFFPQYKTYNLTGVFSDINGCTDTVHEKIEYNRPYANYSPQDTGGCIPFKVNFKNLSKSKYPIVKYDWILDNDSFKSDLKNPTFIYDKVDINTVKLTVTDSKGCKSDTVDRINAGDKVNPDFLALKRTTCNRELFYIENITNHPLIDKVEWSWTVGSSSGDKKNFHEAFHQKPGDYDVLLKATLNGCEDSILKPNYIKILDPYVTIKNIQFDTCKILNRVELKADLIGAHRFFWKIDSDTLWDTTIVLLPEIPSKVTLWGFNDSNKCRDYENLEFPIYPKNIVASIRKETSGECGPIKFVVSSDFSNKQQETRWYINNVLSSKLKSYEFYLNYGGNYNIKLIEDDKKGCTDSMSFEHYIEGGNLAVNVLGKKSCLPISLKLLDSNYSIKGNYWVINGRDTLFSDSAIKNCVVKEMPNNSNGFISVEYKGRINAGCWATRLFKIEVAGPMGSISKTDYKQCASQAVIYRAKVDSSVYKNPVRVDWKMFDGSVSNAYEEIRIIKKAGTYKTSMTLSDSFGCKNIVSDLAYYPATYMSVDFEATPKGKYCPPLLSDFFDLSKATNGNKIIRWEWNFGDGSSSTLRQPKKVFTRAGSFDISLKITDDLGCESTLEKKGFILVDGPVGSFSFDKRIGCVPLLVNFDSKSDKQVFFEWDLGDGNVTRNTKKHNHTYNYSGLYIPSVIITDSIGCKYPLPPIDSIRVVNYPESKFNVLSNCVDNPLVIENNSVSNINENRLEYKWLDINNNIISEKEKPEIKLNSVGSHQIYLNVKNNYGCENTSNQNFELHKPDAKIDVASKNICLGEKVFIKNNSISKYPISENQWSINDSVFSNNSKEIGIILDKKGAYNIVLFISDEKSCKDTIMLSRIIAGDTIAPNSEPILRVSVENNQTLELKHMKHKTIDFDHYEIYLLKNGTYEKLFNKENENDTLHFISPLNVLQKSYCFKVNTVNFCNKKKDLSELLPHCSVESKAEGIVNANIVNWNKYEGWPVEKYEIYRENKLKKGKFDYLATVDENTTTYIDSSIECLTDYYYRIKAQEKNGHKEHSWSDTCRAKPIWKNNVPANEIWRATVEDDSKVLVEWVYPKSYKVPLKSVVLEKSNLNNGSKTNFILDSEKNFLMDEKTKVHEVNYVYKSRVIDICNDTSEFGNIGINILLKTHFDSLIYRPKLTWNTYQKWNEGVDHYIIERKNTQGTFEQIGKTDNGNDSQFIDKDLPLTCTPEYVYRVIGVRNQPVKLDSNFIVVSMSNTSEVFPKSKIFMPNAFSPDNNAINEQFGPKGIFIRKYEFEVFNRWGEKLFETNNCLENWDGKYKGEVCQEGVYLYLLKALGSDNKHYILNGTFTLLK